MYANKGAFTEEKLRVTLFSNTSTRLGNAALSSSRRLRCLEKVFLGEEKLNVTIFA